MINTTVMGIRNATAADAAGIQGLLDQLGYPGTAPFLASKIEKLLQHPLVHLLVYDREGHVAAFIVVEFLIQLGLQGDIMRIGYFAVDEAYRSKGIGAEMERYIEQLARDKNCDRIEVHCHERRKDAHRFYLRQGYSESPKYFMKSLK